MVSQQVSMPSSLSGSRRGSAISLNTLDLDLNYAQGRSLSMIDMKRDTISLCSLVLDEETDGVFEKHTCFSTAYFAFLINFTTKILKKSLLLRNARPLTWAAKSHLFPSLQTAGDLAIWRRFSRP